MLCDEWVESYFGIMMGEAGAHVDKTLPFC